MTSSNRSPVVIDKNGLSALIDQLRLTYSVIGPVLRDRTLLLDEIATIDDLPRGFAVEYDNGSFRAADGNGSALFGYAVGLQSMKKFLYPPRETYYRAQLKRKRFEVATESDEPPRYAFVGVRPCDLKALAIHDRVFIDNDFRDERYAARRQGILVVAVNCTKPGGTCFCASMGTGPGATENFDLALTELISGKDHRFLVEIGSPAGADLLEAIPHQPADDSTVEAARQLIEEASQQMGRTLDVDGVKTALQANPESPRYTDVAKRCLACANCTLVCPTCFCMTVEDTTSLTGQESERSRRWDSCFTLEFSYIHGGSVRPSTRARYRQWLTHKLAGWHDQFGTSGCVGCGRCIVWCPAGIDITEEANAIARIVQSTGEDHAVREETYAANS